MISKLTDHKGAYVWIWLPGETQPVVAGRITQQRGTYAFNYGASYLERDDAIPIYDDELPLRRGLIEPAAGLAMASCLRDGSPDAWGRRVIINRLMGAKAAETDRKLFAGRQFLNSYCIEGLGAEHRTLLEGFEAARAQLLG